MIKVRNHQPDWFPASLTRTQISLIDVKRAYFNVKIDPRDSPTFVQLPPEDKDHATKVARLSGHMYGTHKAADGWQEKYSTFLVSLGFRQGDASHNVFHHQGKNIVTSAHGDDFTSSCPAPSLDWLDKEIVRKYEIPGCALVRKMRRKAESAIVFYDGALIISNTRPTPGKSNAWLPSGDSQAPRTWPHRVSKSRSRSMRPTVRVPST